MRVPLFAVAFAMAALVRMAAQTSIPVALQPTPQSAVATFAPPPDLAMPPADAAKSASGLISRVFEPATALRSQGRATS